MSRRRRARVYPADALVYTPPSPPRPSLHRWLTPPRRARRYPLTPMRVVERGLLPAVEGWKRRLSLVGTVWGFGRSDGTFADCVVASKDAPFTSWDLSMLLWSYGVLLRDTRTHLDVIERILPPLTDAFVRTLKTTPIERQEKADLVKFMGVYNEERASGRFSPKSVRHIGRVMAVMAENFGAKASNRAPNYAPKVPVHRVTMSVGWDEGLRMFNGRPL